MNYKIHISNPLTNPYMGVDPDMRNTEENRCKHQVGIDCDPSFRPECVTASDNNNLKVLSSSTISELLKKIYNYNFRLTLSSALTIIFLSPHHIYKCMYVRKYART